MKFNKMKDFMMGFLLCTVIVATGSTALAAGSFVTLNNVRMGGIRIVVDGQTLNPTDANGKQVSPLIYNGTTYLPVRAVADAVGKSVYWDGPTYTVYLGKMDGALDYPTVMLKDMTDISENFTGQLKSTDRLTDNYGNSYGSAIINNRYGGTNERQGLEYLLNMQYSRFKGTIYIPKGETGNGSHVVTIIADGKQLWRSPDLTKTSNPVPFDVNVTGYNNIKIEIPFEGSQNLRVCLGDAGFYQ